MKATVESLTIKLGDRELVFTMAEAEALRSILSEKLGEKNFGPKIIERIIERNNYPRPIPQWPNRWDITCTTDRAEFKQAQLTC